MFLFGCQYLVALGSTSSEPTPHSVAHIASAVAFAFVWLLLTRLQAPSTATLAGTVTSTATYTGPALQQTELPSWFPCPLQERHVVFDNPPCSEGETLIQAHWGITVSEREPPVAELRECKGMPPRGIWGLVIAFESYLLLTDKSLVYGRG